MNTDFGEPLNKPWYMTPPPFYDHEPHFYGMRDCSRQEIEEIVISTREQLYWYGRNYGAKAIWERMNNFTNIRNLPSVRTIGRILQRNKLTRNSQDW